MRRADIVTAAITVPVDFAMVLLAGVTAYSLRFSGVIAALPPAIAELPFRRFVLFSSLIGLLWVVCMGVASQYSLKGRSAIAELGRTILASSTAIIAIILFIFFQRELFSSRFILLAGWLLAILYITVARLLIRAVAYLMRQRGIGLQQLLVVGTGDLADRIVTELYAGNREGYALAARLADFSAANQEQFMRLVQEKRPHGVLLATTNMPQPDVLALLNAAQEQHLDFTYVADLFATHAGHLTVRTLFGQPVVEVTRTKLDGWGKIWKRAFDVVGSLLLLLITSPIFLVVSLLVLVDSRGSVFVVLPRVGERGHAFGLMKFRSMVMHAQAMKATLMQQNERGDGPLFKMANDPRVTRVGKFLRRTSIDELPQLWNVLRGQMSLVGPRPHEPEEVARYQAWHKKLLTIRPGMTGMAQVSGRASLNFDEEARLDIAYLENWSFATDLLILFRTPRVVFSRRAAV